MCIYRAIFVKLRGFGLIIVILLRLTVDTAQIEPNAWQPQCIFILRYLLIYAPTKYV